jgi:hypothetical protein
MRKEILAQHDIIQKQLRNGKITARQYAQQTKKLFTSPAFTSSEKEKTKEYLAQIVSEKKQKEDLAFFPIKDYLRNDITISSDYQKLQNETAKLRLARIIDYDMFIQEIDRIKTKLPELQLLSELSEMYLTHLYALRELVENRKMLEKRVHFITETVSKLIRNVREETEL